MNYTKTFVNIQKLKDKFPEDELELQQIYG